MAIHRITALWTGFQGAPGYSNFHFMAGGGLISDAQSSADRVQSFFSSLTSVFPTDVVISVQQDVEEIDEDTGAVTAFHTVDGGTPITGNGTGGYSAPSGAVLNWRTNDLRYNRRIRGRTFLVPLDQGSYDDRGTLDPQVQADIITSGNALLGGDLDSELVIWSRPVGGSGGVAATVTNCSVPDMAAVLRSRRD